MSIQKMLLDLQDGNFSGFGYRLLSYVALALLGYLLHRVIRSLARRQETSRTASSFRAALGFPRRGPQLGRFRTAEADSGVVAH
jgi:hypothetical protein